MPMTTGTNTPETLSAIFAMGAFVAAESSTSLIICASAVSLPTLVARHLRKPDVLIVAALTLSPSALSTGTLSPVSADSFTAENPSSTTPSTGILSPGRTTKTSPGTTSAAGTLTSLPSLTIVAVLGVSFTRLLIASVVLPLARASSVFPTVISVRIIAADSKNRFPITKCISASARMGMTNIMTTLYR